MLQLSKTRDLDSETRAGALNFIKSEANKGRHEIGFIPWDGICRADALGRVMVLFNNDDLVGFIVYGPGRTSCKVYQIWVREDARLIVHGRELIDGLREYSLACGLFRISLWCADDLPSNLFWRALRFRKVSQRPGGKHSGRTHNRYVLPLLAPRPSLGEEDFSRTDEPAFRTQQNPHHQPGAACQRSQPRQQALFDPA